MFASQKDGVSALGLARSLEIGSYQTAWAMLHRLRSVLVRPGRERLSGIVEVDETSMGGVEPGLRGGRAKGKKSLVVIAVEHREPKGFGRCRMEPIDDFSSDTLCRFLVDHVEERSTVVTDGLQSYRPAAKDSYIHQRLIVPGDQAGDLSPGVHRVASLAKRWLLGTHQGAVEPDHLGEYLNVLLRWPEASVTSGGTRCRQWRTGSLEVCVTPPSERFRPAARRFPGQHAVRHCSVAYVRHTGHHFSPASFLTSSKESTSSSSASTAATREVGDSSSTACSSLPSRTTRSVTEISSSTRRRSPWLRCRRQVEATHRAWSDPPPADFGEPCGLDKSGQMDSAYAGSLALHLSVLLAGPRPSNGAGPSRLLK
jgi:transposase-like protein